MLSFQAIKTASRYQTNIEKDWSYQFVIILFQNCKNLASSLICSFCRANAACEKQQMKRQNWKAVLLRNPSSNRERTSQFQLNQMWNKYTTIPFPW